MYQMIYRGGYTGTDSDVHTQIMLDTQAIAVTGVMMSKNMGGVYKNKAKCKQIIRS